MIEEYWFPLKMHREGVLSSVEVEHIVQEQSLLLFKKIIDKIMSGEPLPRHKQDLSKGRYFSRKDLEAAKNVTGITDPEELDRRIHAMWFPPYHGVNVTIGGKRYSLVDEELLKELGMFYENEVS